MPRWPKRVLSKSGKIVYLSSLFLYGLEDPIFKNDCNLFRKYLLRQNNKKALQAFDKKQYACPSLRRLTESWMLAKKDPFLF